MCSSCRQTERSRRSTSVCKFYREGNAVGRIFIGERHNSIFAEHAFRKLNYLIVGSVAAYGDTVNGSDSCSLKSFRDTAEIRNFRKN